MIYVLEHDECEACLKLKHDSRLCFLCVCVNVQVPKAFRFVFKLYIREYTSTNQSLSQIFEMVNLIKPCESDFLLKKFKVSVFVYLRRRNFF